MDDISLNVHSRVSHPLVPLGRFFPVDEYEVMERALTSQWRWFSILLRDVMTTNYRNVEFGRVKLTDLQGFYQEGDYGGPYSRPDMPNRLYNFCLFDERWQYHVDFIVTNAAISAEDIEIIASSLQPKDIARLSAPAS